MRREAGKKIIPLLLILVSALQINVLAAFPDSLIPVGSAVGIYLNTEGVIVSDVAASSETGITPAKKAGICSGDIICKVNDIEIKNAEELTRALSERDGDVSILVERDGKEIQLTVTPEEKDGRRTIGVWIRDSISGIGTITFFDPEKGVFGALGHSVEDVDTGVLVPLGDGKVVAADVSGVVRGQPGTPGQLSGIFDVSEPVGDVSANTDAGIFGTVRENWPWEEGKLIPVCKRSEIKTGDAVILTTVDGKQCQEYPIEISRIFSDDDDGRSMMIKITDEKLLSLTGGIVQGMSGSPIIQDGKLVGAVTHVLVNDPTKGYGISIEKMLEHAQIY